MELKRLHAFKYLGSTLSADGSEDKEITERIQEGWKNWRHIRGIVRQKNASDIRGEGVQNCGKEAVPVQKINKEDGSS